MQIDVLRPTANFSADATWVRRNTCAAPAAETDAFWQILSDDDDDTFAFESGVSTDRLAVSLGSQTPPAGHERHRHRLRTDFLTTPGGAYQARSRSYAGNPDTSTPLATRTVVVGGFGTPNCGLIEDVAGWLSFASPNEAAARTFYYAVWNLTESVAARVAEAYLEIDNRAQPSFAADVLDGAGASSGGGTITDTPIPRLVFGSTAYDDLPARTWRWAVYTLAQTMAGGFAPFVTAPVDEDAGNGNPPAETSTIPLANDDYVAYLQISSTIRSDSQFDSDIESVAFEIAFQAPPPPDVAATVQPTPPAVDVCWSEPTFESGDTVWDDATDLVAEVQRSDCGADFVTIHVSQTGFDGCHIDRFVPLSGEGVFCGEHDDDDCSVIYRVRYWGLVDDVLVASDWTTADAVTVDNPTPGNAWLRGPVTGDLSVCPTESWSKVRPFGRFQPASGGLPTVVTGAPGGRDYQLTIPVTSLADLATLEGILAAALVYYQPPLQPDLWLAPSSENYTITKVKRIHEVTVSTVAVAAQPQPTPQSFF